MHWATAGVTATSGVDFVASSGNVTFFRGETRKTVPVVVKGDATVELDETLRVNLSSPVSATTVGFGMGTIADDDRPAFSVNDVSVTEGNTGTKAMKFTVTLSKALTQTATVAFATANGSARTVVDYATTVGSLTFKAGKVSLTVKVSIVGDKVREPNETLLLTLSKASTIRASPTPPEPAPSSTTTEPTGCVGSHRCHGLNQVGRPTTVTSPRGQHEDPPFLGPDRALYPLRPQTVPVGRAGQRRVGPGPGVGMRGHGVRGGVVA